MKWVLWLAVASVAGWFLLSKKGGKQAEIKYIGALGPTEKPQVYTDTVPVPNFDEEKTRYEADLARQAAATNNVGVEGESIIAILNRLRANAI